MPKPIKFTFMTYLRFLLSVQTILFSCRQKADPEKIEQFAKTIYNATHFFAFVGIPSKS
jgi:hypothetical protein